MKIYYTTNIGLNRKKNEDSLLIFDEIISGKSYDEVMFKGLEVEEAYFAIADGMGGYSFGEIASKTILELLRSSSFATLECGEVVLQNIQKNLYKKTLEHKEYYGMGSVLSGIKISDDKIFIFNVGDSRTYRIHSNKIDFITEDDSLVYALYKRGLIEFDEMRKHPNKNIVTSCYRAVEENLVKYSINEFKALKGDRYFICSDGLWEMIESLKLEEILCSTEWELVIKNLLELAIFEGGRDNISFILVEI